MSPLAFDKQGKPFAWHRRTRKLLVRLFRNPAARGTCCQVLDADGNPLYIDAETEYGEFRKAVGNVPGLYRLDQCDDDGVEIDDAQPAYVSIELTRNVSLTGEGGDVDPLVIIEHMFAIHADVMKTMAMQQASIMAASAEILRAPFRPAAPGVKPESPEQDEEEEEDDELEPAPEPDPWAAWRPMLEMVEPHLPKLGAFLFAQFAAFMKQNATPPAAAPSPPPGSVSAANNAAVPSQSAESASVAAGSSPAPGTSESPRASAPSHANTHSSASMQATPTPAAVAADAAASAPSHSGVSSPPTATSTEAAAPNTTATATTASSSATAHTIAPAGTSPRNAAPEPTPAQWQHLYEIRERLSPKERAIAENAMMRMTSELLVQWLDELSALPVDDAVRAIRSMIATLPTARGGERG